MASSSSGSRSLNSGSLNSGSLRRDFVAGFLVALIALPLCLGIAMASGFPPLAGVLTAVVGGIVVNFLGSAPLTIKGPAAGLIVIAFGAVTELGQGDMLAGYRYTLAVGVIAAVIQIILALLRAASRASAMPIAVVHGMLAAIGLIIVARQAHTALGVAPESERPLALLFEIPSSVVHANPEIAIIGLAALVIAFGFPWLARRLTRLAIIPAPVLVLIVAVALGYVFDLAHDHYYRMLGGNHHLGPEYLLHLPGSLIDALALPDFSKIGTLISIKYVVLFALVGSLESTLGVVAVDTLDPDKRRSDLDRDLLVVGIGNLIASAIGGLPMVSEVVRSKANVDAGGRSRFANFSHGLLLLGCVALLPAALEHVPLAALAAMLVYTGVQLVVPAARSELHDSMAPSGERHHLALFVVTLLITLMTDPLVGVAAGLGMKILLHGVGKLRQKEQP
jgi:MFS superfamily sulfate permease-like transporter